ncbi:unnamed protein product [Chilo suppressalis]|uniref:Uncharacterized protein n=1 Tax=Chilo suppressalis TaxID=168631 RepID=A0ABN8BHE3_CHISP|nr:unnamed protein product [Chilo suppressalis]
MKDFHIRKLLSRFCISPHKEKKNYKDYFREKILAYRYERNGHQPGFRKKYQRDCIGDCFLMSLRKTPQVWIYHRWPHIYPYYLEFRHTFKSFGTCCMLCAAVLFWTPCFICFELCHCIICCCCCSDC